MAWNGAYLAPSNLAPTDLWGDLRRLRPALFGLRLFAGSALIVVAFTEKLARPGMTLHFLAEHPHFNVAQLIGLPVSDELFVQLAGGIEILLGLLLISGALPDSWRRSPRGLSRRPCRSSAPRS
jgi:hypothetical protein